MSSRRRAREIALQILYRYDVTITSAPMQGPRLTPQILNDPRLVLEDLNRHFEHFQVPPSIRPFATELVAGTLRDLTKLDTLLEKHAVNWKVTRMSSVDRCLLRMAAYELLNFKDIPHSVTLNEAIELSKQFGTSDSSAFINGILDAIRQENSADSA